MSRRKRLDRNMATISQLYPNVHTVYGPYLGKDGRYRVVLYDGTRRITRQYAKLKMEIKLGRRLHEHDETVDHFDDNKRNDRYSNLRILPRGKHASEDALRRDPVTGQCKWCATWFLLSREQLAPRNATKPGPYCSPSCRGKGNMVGLSGRKSTTRSYHRKKLK